MAKSLASRQAGNASVKGASSLFNDDKARLSDLMPEMVAYIDRDRKVRYLNQKYAEARNLDAKAVIGRPCEEVAGPVNFMAIQRQIEDALAGSRLVFEYDLIRDGAKRRMSAEYIPDRDRQGRVAGILAIMTDISTRLALHEQMQENDVLFEYAFSNSPIGMALVDTAGILLRANRSFASMLKRSVPDLQGINFSTITHPDDIDADVLLFRQVVSGIRDGYKIDKRYLGADGSVVEAVLTVTAMRNAAGEIVRFISQIEDVTDQRENLRQIAEANAQLQLAIDALRGGDWHMDITANRFETSQRLARYIAGPQSSPLGIDAYMERMNPSDREGADLMPLITGALDRNTAEYRLQTPEGERWMRCDRKLVRDMDGTPRKIVGVVIDITKEREQIRQSEAQANTDSLTGLLNRRGFEKRCQREGTDQAFAILAIDLDGFKLVNDRFGHAAGDQVLMLTAARLASALGETDFAARLGGDEFVLTLVGADRMRVEEVATRILSTVRQPIAVAAGDVSVGCSIGAYCLGAWPSDIAAAQAEADEALYEAKAAGKNTVRFG